MAEYEKKKKLKNQNKTVFPCLLQSPGLHLQS